MLLKIVKTHRMKQLFTSKTITYLKKNVNNIIDFVFIIFLLIESFIKCRIKSNIYSSNHFSIEIVFNLHTIQQSTKNTRQYRKTNINVLQKSMKQKFQMFSFFSLKNVVFIDERVNFLIFAITRSIEKSTSLIKIYKYFKLDFNEKCKKTVQKIKRLHKLYQKKKLRKNIKEI